MKRLFAAALIVAAAPVWAQETRLHCFGTEPFWDLSVGARDAVYGTPDGPKIRYTPSPPRHADGTQPDFVRVYELTRADRAGTATLAVTRHERPCSDGMSDKKFTYYVLLIDQDRVRHGCCNWLK